MQENNKPYILAIDHGTSGCKVAVISIDGEVADFEFEPTPLYFFPGGGVEQDPEDWWNGIVNATKKLLSREKVSPRDIVSVAVSSTFSTTVAVDKRGKSLIRAITWMILYALFLKGVAYNAAWNLNYVEKFISRQFDYINIIGGGAQSDLWCQIFADVMSRNIRQFKDPMQANARGGIHSICRTRLYKIR